jgi:SAM-dependent methyltransferase
MALILKKFLAVPCFLAACGGALAQQSQVKELDTPFVVSPEEVVDRMLRIGNVGPGDRMIDLGSGDGRIVIEAARRGATGFGVDIDPQLVALATKNAEAAGVGDRAKFYQRDLFQLDMSGADVITFYLLPDVNRELMPKFAALKPGTRLVSHDYGIGDWPPDETIEIRAPEKTVGLGGLSKIMLFIVPANARGDWQSTLPAHGGDWRFSFAQRYQVLDSRVATGGRELSVRGARLRGEEIKIVATGLVAGIPYNHLFKGMLRGDRIEGEVLISNGREERKLPWTATRTAASR